VCIFSPASSSCSKNRGTPASPASAGVARCVGAAGLVGGRGGSECCLPAALDASPASSSCSKNRGTPASWSARCAGAGTLLVASPLGGSTPEMPVSTPAAPIHVEKPCSRMHATGHNPVDSEGWDRDKGRTSLLHPFADGQLHRDVHGIQCRQRVAGVLCTCLHSRGDGYVSLLAASTHSKSEVHTLRSAPPEPAR
jgi:hypothetical protein